jgi:hypothetical protein
MPADCASPTTPDRPPHSSPACKGSVGGGGGRSPRARILRSSHLWSTSLPRTQRRRRRDSGTLRLSPRAVRCCGRPDQTGFAWPSACPTSRGSAAIATVPGAACDTRRASNPGAQTGLRSDAKRCHPIPVHGRCDFGSAKRRHRHRSPLSDLAEHSVHVLVGVRRVAGDHRVG